MGKYRLHRVCVSDDKQLLSLSLFRGAVQTERLVSLEDLGVCLECQPRLRK